MASNVLVHGLNLLTRKLVEVGAILGSLRVTQAGTYETVAASQSDQTLGVTGAAGDCLQGLLVVPATTSPGTISIKDGSGSAINVFVGGASSVPNTLPFYIPLNVVSTGGAWKVTTGANVSVIAVGQFTP